MINRAHEKDQSASLMEKVFEAHKLLTEEAKKCTQEIV